MTATSPSTQGSPLATFALFAYNQEQYIRDAITAAFAQTYEPLEIILSDDASSDRTFEIMQDMTSSYTGPHIVRLRRSANNLGLASHINVIAEEFTGKYLVLAAGDDISFPERTAACVAILEEKGVSLVHSMVTYIDTDNRTISHHRSHEPLLWGHADGSSAAGSLSLYIGATGAVTRDFLEKFGPISYHNAYEDLVFGFRSILGGGSYFIRKNLVRYRFGCGISHNRTDLTVGEMLAKEKRRLMAYADVYRQRLRDLDAVSEDYSQVREFLIVKLHEMTLRIARRKSLIAFTLACLSKPATTFRVIAKRAL
ncbi:hypothetical protein C5F48_21485 [Cereibacter changlensis JA139]|uniref:Glycosyltransferase 2-like domain-containing protein n=2 Tax=Cereibacter changlensis TaxID=402884 RepID=A0A2T4JP67_9RHOB|nr:glycosyltransferase [Cereibacter changlensis]PTE19702.1 hypothetical protein C5F48_21485 [Cereibacter changlensis JA139]PZX48367.1 glycosyl transferase family 2 [Cereibacter changlensis]